jgi:hypothetical protein
MECEFEKKSKYVSKFQLFKSLLPHVNGVECTWNIKQSCNLWYKKVKLKVIIIFW